MRPHRSRTVEQLTTSTLVRVWLDIAWIWRIWREGAPPLREMTVYSSRHWRRWLRYWRRASYDKLVYEPQRYSLVRQVRDQKSKSHVREGGRLRPHLFSAIHIVEETSIGTSVRLVVHRMHPYAATTRPDEYSSGERRLRVL